MDLPSVPIYDHRADGMFGYIHESLDRAERVMDTVIDGLGRAGRLGRLLLPVADRIADRRLTLMMDPYLTEIRAVQRMMGRPGPIAFSLSYEFGCTARAFDGGEAPVLFRTLDWPFRGIGELVEIVILPGDAGDWIAATWPGVVGCLQGAAPGRFAAAINQAPERTSRSGRTASWISSKRNMMRQTGIPPAHLLRQVFETATDYEEARRLLATTPVAAPVIFTLTGIVPGEACTIERTERNWAITDVPAAANHFVSELSATSPWRSRGEDSEGRRAAILAADAPPALDDLAPPVLNSLTRLAVTASAGGGLAVAGYEGDRRVTAVTAAEVPSSAPPPVLDDVA